MSAKSGHFIVETGTAFSGQVRGGERIEIKGTADGSIVAKLLVIPEGGSFEGIAQVDQAEVHGKLRGDVKVRHLLTISETGDVAGNIQYGQMAIAKGGNLVADVRNVPPELAGDFELHVARGDSVAITPEDLSATDADDTADALTFTAANLLHGHIARKSAPADAITRFTQADVNTGDILFVHDGAPTNIASFDVVVADDEGATAGPPQVVLVRVSDSAPASG